MRKVIEGTTIFAVAVVLFVLIGAAVIRASEPPATGDYIETPSGNTKIYKFVDEDGSKCYIAENSAGVSLQCQIAEDAK